MTNILSRLFGRKQSSSDAVVNAAGQFLFAPFLQGTALWSQSNFRSIVVEGYRKNEIVYSAIRRKAQSLAEAPARVRHPDGTAWPDHPVAALLKRPHPKMSGDRLLELTVHHLDLAGEAYWAKIRSAVGKVVGFWPLRPDRVEVVPDPVEYIRGYLYTIEGRQVPILAEDVVRFIYPDPLDDYRGLSPLAAAARRIDIDNEGADFLKITLQRQGVPGYAIKGKSAPPERADRTRLAQIWHERFGGGNKGDPIFLGNTEDIVKLSMNLDELAFSEITSLSETRICAAIGVPPALLGLKTGIESSNLSGDSLPAARQSFYQDTISPLQNFLDDVITHSLALDFGDDFEVYFDTSNVSALWEVRSKESAAAREGWTAGVLLLNEARKKMGLEPIRGGDIRRTDLATITIPAEIEGAETRSERVPDVREDVVVSKAQRRAKRLGRKSVSRDDVRLLRLALGRSSLADRFLALFLRDSKAEMRAQAEDLLDAMGEAGLKSGKKASNLSPAVREALDAAVDRFGPEWSLRAQNRFRPLLQLVVEDSARAASAEIGLDFRLPPEKVLSYVEGYSFRFADAISSQSADQVREAVAATYREGLDRDDLIRRLGEIREEWTGPRADRIARSETIRAANRGAALTYAEEGVRELEWIASDDACPYCLAFDGKVVSTGTAFARDGESVAGIDEDGEPVRPMVVDYEDVDTPPLHPNCRCAIVARD